MAETKGNRPSLIPKLALSLVSLLTFILLLGVGELYCRYFLDINFRKTSKTFLQTDPAGRASGNARNAQGTSFGVEVWSDENGFRVPPGYTAKPHDSAILILGDSVAFGVGVEEEKTFVGMLRQHERDVTVYNSAVVGYSIADYKRVAETFLPSRPEVDRVYLVYCLNDFHSGEHPDEPVEKSDGTLVSSAKRAISSLFVALNEALGPRSKLYVYITGKASDPSRRYFEWDLSLMNVGDQKLGGILWPIVEIDRTVKARNGIFKVVINPYEMQLRQGSNGNYEPQDRIKGFLAKHNVDVIDTREDFPNGSSSGSAFLFADPMHLNETGHRIVFDALQKDLRNNR
jgi:lysophospholipase L1-like esterase